MVRNKVQIVIFKKEEKDWEALLLQTNVRRGEFWQNVTGSVEDHDSEIIEGAFREVEEETSVKKNEVIKFFTLPLVYKFRDQWGRDIEEFTFVFIVKANAKIKLDPSEHQNFQWLKCEVIEKNHYKYSSNFEVYQAGLKWVKQYG